MRCKAYDGHPDGPCTLPEEHGAVVGCNAPYRFDAGELLRECRKLDRSVKVTVSARPDGSRELVVSGKRIADGVIFVPEAENVSAVTRRLLVETLHALRVQRGILP